MQQRGADQRVDGDDRGKLADLVRAQHVVVEQMIVEIARGDRIGLFLGVKLEATDILADCTVEQAGIEIRQAIMLRQRTGDGALARCGGAVDGNDQWSGHSACFLNSSSVWKNIG